MSETIESLHAKFKEIQVPIFSDGENTLLYRFAHRNQMLLVEISLLEEGQYIRFVIPWFFALYSGGHREEVMLKLLERNRTLKLLKFGCDPADGEVALAIETYIGENSFTSDQLYRYMFLFTNVALKERDHLFTLQETGVYPDSTDADFEETVRRILDTVPDPSEESEESEESDESEESEVSNKAQETKKAFEKEAFEKEAFEKDFLETPIEEMFHDELAEDTAHDITDDVEIIEEGRSIQKEKPIL